MVKTLKINKLSANIYYPNSEAKKVVIGIHGFGGDKESSVLVKLGESLAGTDNILITYDLPCHGESEGELLNLKDCLDSVNEVYNFAQSEFKNMPISFFATSFGGYLLLSYLEKFKPSCDKIILRAPAIYMGSILENIIIPDHNFSLSDLKKAPLNLGYEREVLVDLKFLNDLYENDLDKVYNSNYFFNIMQGKLDDTVNYLENDKFFNLKCKDNYKMFYFENADHRFKKPGEIERIMQIALDILK